MAEIEADRAVEALVERGIVKRDEAGNAVLKEMATIVLAKDPVTKQLCYPVRDRLVAARMVLDFTLTKPAAKVDLAMTAEGLLASMLGQNPDA